MPEEDCLWIKQFGYAYRRIPISMQRELTPNERLLFKEKGIFLLDFHVSGKEESSLYSIHRCDLSGYGLNKLSVKARNKTRRGTEYCSCRQISFSELGQLGYKCLYDTLKKREKAFIPDAESFRSKCEIWEKYNYVVMCFGAFVQDKLAAWTILIDWGNHLDIPYLRSDSEMLKYRPNNALLYYICTYFSNQYAFIDFGTNSLEGISSIDRFKEGMAFQRVPVRRVLLRAPSIRWIPKRVLCLLFRLGVYVSRHKHRFRKAMKIAEFID